MFYSLYLIPVSILFMISKVFYFALFIASFAEAQKILYDQVAPDSASIFLMSCFSESFLGYV